MNETKEFALYGWVMGEANGGQHDFLGFFDDIQEAKEYFSFIFHGNNGGEAEGHISNIVSGETIWAVETQDGNTFKWSELDSDEEAHIEAPSDGNLSDKDFIEKYVKRLEEAYTKFRRLSDFERIYAANKDEIDAFPLEERQMRGDNEEGEKRLKEIMLYVDEFEGYPTQEEVDGAKEENKDA